MAQAGFVLSDEGRTISAVNDSTTTAITAGDPVFFTTNNDVLTGTASTARAAYTDGDIKVKSLMASATGYLQPAGVALTDCAASTTTETRLTVALEGVFIHATNSDTEAGDPLQFDEAASQKVDVLDVATATVGFDIVAEKCGRALTGGSADGKFIIWKLTL